MNSTISIYPHLAFPSPPPYVFPQEQPTFIKSRLSESPATSDTSSVEHPTRDNSHRASRFTIAHPYARLYAKKDGSKRRKIWNHVLEKQLFSPQELSVLIHLMLLTINFGFRSTMGAPHRRTIYIASLEAHIDRLHNQLLGIGLYPIPFQRLEPYRGLNSKTAKVSIQFLFPI